MDLRNQPVRSVPKPRHKRRVDPQVVRGKFSKMIRDEVKAKYNNQCAMCGKRGCHIHHVMPKGRGGRGVITNALLLCNGCHREIHAEDKLLRHWIRQFAEMYGKHFYHDRDDLQTIYRTEFGKKSNQEVQKWLEHNEVFEVFRK